VKAIGIAISILGFGAAIPAAEAQSPPPQLTFAFEETFTVGPARVVDNTPAGRRQTVPVMEGTVAGPGISGRVLAGGADDQLVRPGGTVTIDAHFLIETDDHVTIRVHNVGLVVPPKAGETAYAWSTQSLEAPSGRYGWLSKAVFVSRIGVSRDGDRRTVKLTAFKIG
jgi:hypothetical protein